MGQSAFNAEMLILARESRGLKQAEFALAASLSQGEVSKVETGIRIPSAQMVEKFARVLNYPEEFFF